MSSPPKALDSPEKKSSMSSWGEDSHTTKDFIILRGDLRAASQVAHSLHRWHSPCVCLCYKPLKLPQYLPLMGHLSPRVTFVLPPHLKPFLPFGILVGITKSIHTPLPLSLAETVLSRDVTTRCHPGTCVFLRLSSLGALTPLCLIAPILPLTLNGIQSHNDENK